MKWGWGFGITRRSVRDDGEGRFPNRSYGKTGMERDDAGG